MTDKIPTTQVAVVHADADGTIRLWNAGAEALLGYSATRAVGQKVDLIVPESYREAHWIGFHGAMARGKLNGDEPFVLPIECADGQVKHFAGRLHMLRDAYPKNDITPVPSRQARRDRSRRRPH